MPFVLFETPIGTCGLAFGDAGLTRFSLPEATTADLERRLRRARNADEGDDSDSRTTVDDAPAWVREAVARVKAHLGGAPQDLESIPVDFSGLTPFVSDVYRALRRVPAGQTTSYGELARSVGSEGAARAVGRAMAENPFPLVVPCHRVLPSDGSRGGFSAHGGAVTKERLLSLEGFRWSSQSSLNF